MKNRTEKICAMLQKEHADAFALFNREGSGQPATRYICGFSGSESILVVSRKKVFIIVDGRYISQAASQARGAYIIKAIDAPALSFFYGLAKKERFGKILVDGNSLAYSVAEKIRRALGASALKSKEGILQEMRAVKDASEVRCIAKAAAIAIGAFCKLLKEVKPDVYEKYLAARLEFLMKECGAERAAFDTIVASGANGARPHAEPSYKKIKKGELVIFDFGAVYNGYACDITRTVAVGKISARLRDIYEAARRAQVAGCKAARAGISGAALDKIVRDSVARAGYGKYFLHGTGHGLGMEVHELPIVSRANSSPMQAGSVVTCEPGVYIDGLGGARIEDDLVLTKTGAKNLTSVLTSELITIHAR